MILNQPASSSAGLEGSRAGLWARRAGNRLLGLLLVATTLGGLFEAAPTLAEGPTATTDPAPQAAAFDAKTIALDAELPLDSAVRSGRLDNGFTYFIRKNGKPEKRAELRLAVNAGAVLEAEDQRGLAHFLEHMAFNGTRDLPKHELVDYLQQIGMRFGADLNAYTAFDETVYMLTVPTDDQALLDKGLLILENWADGISFDADEIEKEKGVVVEEWRLGRGAFQRAFDQALPLLFKDSLYAERLPIGTKESIEGANREKLLRFYRDWYRPDNMAVVLVGDFDPMVIEAKVKAIFGKIPQREGKKRPEIGMPSHKETLVSLVEDAEMPMTQIGINYKHPAEPSGTAGDYRRGLVEQLYHAMFNARLAEISKSADPPFLMARSDTGSFVRPLLLYSLDAVVRDGGAVPAIEALLREVERVDRFGFTATELQRAKVDLLRGYEQALKERDKLPSQPLADEYVRHFLEDEPAPGIEAEAALAQRFAATITLEEINQLGRTWIRDDNRVVLASGPAKKEAALPSEAEVLALFSKTDKAEIQPYVDQVREEPLVSELPPARGVLMTKTVEEIGVTEWKMKNGARVLLKPTDFQNDQILFSAWSPGGSSLFSDEDFPSGSFAVQAMAASGLGAFKAAELEKKLSGKVADVRPFIAEIEEGLQGQASPQDLETLLQLVYLEFTAPRLDPEIFKNFKDRMENFLSNRGSSPAAQFQDAMTRALWKNHPRRQPPSLAMLDKITAAQMLSAYKDRFADASDFTFLFVGNFEPEKIQPLIEQYLGALPAPRRGEKFKDFGLRFPAKAESFRVEKGVDPKSMVQMIYGGEAPWSREAIYQLDSLTDALQIRLNDLIREEMGATYGVGIFGGLEREPASAYQIVIRLSSGPEEVDAVVKAIRGEIERFRQQGPPPEVLAKVKETQRREREVKLRDNAFWLGALETYYGNELDPRLILDHEKLLAGLSVDSLKAAAQLYFNPERSVLGVLDPEKAPEKAPEAAKPEEAAKKGS